MAEWAYAMALITGAGLPIALLGLGVTVAGVLLVLQSLRHSRQALFAEQRPWIEVEITPEIDLFFEKNVLTTRVNVSLKNVGSAPAFDVFFEVRMIVAEEGSEAVTQMIKASNSIRSDRKLETAGYLIFPQKDVSSSKVLNVDWKDIEASILFQTTRMADLYVFAAVEYQSNIGVVRPHQTGALFELLRTFPNVSGHYMIFPQEDNPQGHLVLRPAFGSFAN